MCYLMCKHAREFVIGLHVVEQTLIHVDEPAGQRHRIYIIIIQYLELVLKLVDF